MRHTLTTFLSGVRDDRERQVKYLVSLVLLVLIAYPLAPLLSLSFRESRDDASLTTRWYAELLTPDVLEVMRNTAVVVGSTVAISVSVGLAMAWTLARYDVPFKRFGAIIPLAPLLIPPIVGAAAWQYLLSPGAGYLNRLLQSAFGLEAPGPIDIYGVGGIIFVMSIYVVPYSFTALYPAVLSMDRRVEEAAMVSGASRLTASRTVTLSLLKPALTAATIAAFVISIAHFTIPLLIGQGQVQVLTTEIYRSMTTFPPVYGQATSLSVVGAIPAFLLIAWQFRLARRGSFATVGGKGGRSTLETTRPMKVLGSVIVIGYALLALVLPLGALVLTSVKPFWDGRLTLTGADLDHYRYIFGTYPSTWPAIRTSLLLGLVCATVSVLIGFVVAYLTNRRSSGKATKFLDFLATVPAGIPSTLIGVGFLLAFTRPPLLLYGTVWVPILAYLVIFLPHAIRPMSAAAVQVDPELEEAARVAGATWSRGVSDVPFRLMLASIVGAWTLLFIMLTREVSASVFLTTPGTKLVGVTMLDLWREAENGPLAALSLTLVATSSVFVIGANRLMNKGARHS